MGDTPPPKPPRCSIQKLEDEPSPSPQTPWTEHLSTDEEEESWAIDVHNVWPLPDNDHVVEKEIGEVDDSVKKQYYPVPKPRIKEMEKKLKNCINRVIKLEERLPSGNHNMKDNSSDVVVNIKLNISQGKCYIEGDKRLYGYVVGRMGSNLHNISISTNEDVNVVMPPKREADRTIKITSRGKNVETLLHAMNCIIEKLSKYVQ